MKRYSFIHVPVMSFYSRALYRDVCFNWKGTGFGYLLLLLAACWTVPMIKLHIGFGKMVDQEAPKIVSQIPALSIIKGKAVVDASQPYRITNPETGETLVVIDTTGSITSLEDVKAIGLITEKQAIFKKSEVETRTFNFKEIEQFSLDQETVTGWLQTARKVLAPILYPIAVLGSFIGRTIQVLLYAVLGLVIASACRVSRTYPELLRLAVVAVTPCIILKTILDAAEVRVPLAGLVFFLAAMGFLFFGVQATARPEDPAGPSAMDNA